MQYGCALFALMRLTSGLLVDNLDSLLKVGFPERFENNGVTFVVGVYAVLLHELLGREKVEIWMSNARVRHVGSSLQRTDQVHHRVPAE